MRSMLASPRSGSDTVLPSSALTIHFARIHDNWRERMHVRIGGEWAIKQGVPCEPYTVQSTNDFWSRDGHTGEVRLRRRGGFPSEDLMVEAWTRPENAAVNQRIFVRGARTYPQSPAGYSKSRVIPGGVFGIRQGQWRIYRETYDVPDHL